MNFFKEVFTASVGKKLVMAFTGIGFLGFLFLHLAGNINIFLGKEAFDSYARHLHSFGYIIHVAEIFLLLMAILHIGAGFFLFWQNLKARPEKYAVKKSAGGRTFASATMPYTGIFILLFTIIHLANFHFADKSSKTVYEIVAGTFENPVYVAGYIFSVVIVAIHVSHGLWSAFQTVGANNSRYMPFITKASIIFAVAVGAGFGLMPLYIFVS